MGADTFFTTGHGKTAQEAFTNAREEALYEYGHRGYTGTIAEKNGFKIITVPEGREPHEYADELVMDGDPRVDDKWGPAGCIEIGSNTYLFFGWASS